MFNPPYGDITGFVLAGGASRRLGTDKRRVLVGGVSLLDRTRTLIEDVLGRPAYVVGDNLSGLVVDPRFRIRDAKNGCGPMGGLVAAINRCSTEWALILAVDFPRLGTGDIRVLADHRSQAFDVVALSRDGHPEPLAALYQVRAAHYWRRHLDDGMLSVIDAIRKLRWKPITIGRAAAALDSLNTPEDLAGVINT